MTDTVIIGGGAAGSMAAIQAARLGKSVVLLERNGVIGRKLRITGKGRCNVTNNSAPQEHLSNIPVNPRFLYSAFSSFDAYDTMSFFEELGVPLLRRDNRVLGLTAAGEALCEEARLLLEQADRAAKRVRELGAQER